MREVVPKIDWNEIIKDCNVEDDLVTIKKVIINIRDKYNIFLKRVVKFL